MIVTARKRAITNPQNVYEILLKILNSENEVDQMKEHFWVLGLNARNVIQYIELVSLGTLTLAFVHPREVFRFAIMKAISSLMIAHNHPSGDPEPSQEDLKLTRRLVDAGKIIGIELLDHIIIGNGGDFSSFKEKMLIL
jgi:DNA repair protein RadC